MRPNNSYLICATCRTGSNLLCEALKDTGVAGKPAEHFRFFQGSNYENFIGKGITKGLTLNGVFGVKIMMNHLDKFVHKLKRLSKFKGQDIATCDLLSYAFPNLHYIWITRRNKIRQAVSLYKAVRTGDWGVRKKKVDPKQLEFDSEIIDHLLRQLVIQDAAWQEFFSKNKITPLVVIYEDFAQNYKETILKILKYLGISIPCNISFNKPKLKKQADSLSEQWVQQYRTLKQAEWPGNVCGT